MLMFLNKNLKKKTSISFNNIAVTALKKCIIKFNSIIICNNNNNNIIEGRVLFAWLTLFSFSRTLVTDGSNAVQKICIPI